MAKKPSKSTKRKLTKIKSVVNRLKHTASHIKEKVKKGDKQAKNKATAALNAAKINFSTTKTLQNKAKSFATKNKLTIQTVMNNALKEYLAKPHVAKNNNNNSYAKVPINNQDQTNNY